MLVLVSFIEVLLLTKISMKNLLHKNVSYKTIGTIFSIFVLIAIIGSDKFSSTPTAPTSSTQEGFYTNSKKGFTAQFPAGAVVTEGADGAIYADIEKPYQLQVMVNTWGNTDAVPREKWISTKATITDATTLQDLENRLPTIHEKVYGSKPRVVSSELSTVDGVPAYFVEMENDQLKLKSLWYALLKNGHFYEIAITYSSDEDSYVRPIFNKLIESFKVL
jgi:hypothetical protein